MKDYKELSEYWRVTAIILGGLLIFFVVIYIKLDRHCHKLESEIFDLKIQKIEQENRNILMQLSKLKEQHN